MKIRKTRQEKRSTYTYYFENGESCELKPEENGVTEAHIKLQYSLDDSDVYYNNKNMHSTRTDEQKAEIKVFEDKFIADFKKLHGYEPNPSYVKDTIKEVFPTNWNLSLDWEMESEGGDDKSKLALATSVEMEQSNPAVDRLYEVMESMTDKQRKVIRMVYLEGYTQTEVSKTLGVKPSAVNKHLKKAMEYIKVNYQKK